MMTDQLPSAPDSDRGIARRLLSRRDMLGRLIAAALAPTILAPSARAQAVRRFPRLALVSAVEPVGAMTESGGANWAALLRALKDSGYIENQTVVIDRWSFNGQRERLAPHAYRIADSRPDVAIVAGLLATEALRAATSTMPIVHIGTLPDTVPFVRSFQRPGGNVTGIAVESGAQMQNKRIDFLHQAVPNARRFGYLGPRGGWPDGEQATTIREATAARRLTLVPLLVDAPVNEAGLKRALSGPDAQSIDALYVASDQAFVEQRATIAALIRAAKLPAIGNDRGYVEGGLLLSYSARYPVLFRQAASYVDRILKGEKPGNLPIEQPSTFDLVVNLGTADAIGLKISPTLRAAATELIE